MADLDKQTEEALPSLNNEIPDTSDMSVAERSYEPIRTHNRNPSVRLGSVEDYTGDNVRREGWDNPDPQKGEYMDSGYQKGVYKDEYFDNSPVIAERMRMGDMEGFVTQDLGQDGMLGAYYNDMLQLDSKPNRTPFEQKALEEYRTFFTNRTGMAEGGPVERDPVSGNEVPPGSEPHNVRDDIPAMLSEGEFVIPANVVKYYGVEKFDKMIDQAEAKLDEMDKKGRIGGEGDGMFLGGLYSNYPSSNVEVAQAPLFDMYQWIFPGISAFWETTATKPRSAPSKEKPEDKIKWVYQTPEREEGGGDVDPNSNLWTMDKGKFRQIASTGRFNPLDNLFGRLGENFQGIASQSRKSYLRAALEVAKERGMDQDIVSGLEQKLESLGGYQEVEGEGLLGREVSRLNEITGPARWEQVYNYHSAQAGRETIPDPKNPYTAPGADRPQRAGGPAMPGSLGERINQRIDRTVERITGNPVVDDVLTTVGSPSGGDGGTAAPVERDPLPGPEVRSGFMANPYKDQYLELSPYDREKLTEMGVDFRGRPYESSTEREGYEVYELDPSIVGPAMRADMIPPSERPAFTAVMGPAIDYDRYVSNTPRTLIEPSPMGGPRRQSNQMDTPSIPPSTPSVTVGNIEYGTAPSAEPMDVRVSRVLDRTPVTPRPDRLTAPGLGMEPPVVDDTSRVRGPSGDPNSLMSRTREQLSPRVTPEEAVGAIEEQKNFLDRLQEGLMGIRGAAAPENRPGGGSDTNWNAIGERAAVWESRGEDDSSNAGPSVMSEGPSQPSNPQPYNEPSPSRSVNTGGGRGGNEPPQEDYDKGGQPFNKGGYVQRPVSYAKGGYVTRKKGKR